MMNTQPTNEIQANALIEQLGIKKEYPFRHHFIDAPHGRMHYVDEGQGPTILALHGNPTWSYLYRDFITGLSGSYRIVAPDYIGFGLSEKPSNVDDYSVDSHLQDIEHFILELNLTNITLMLHDWGGPIGLNVAARNPDRIRALVLMNTRGFFPTSDAGDPNKEELILPLKLMRSDLLGSFLVRKLGFFERVAMKMGMVKKERYTEIKKAYCGVFTGPKDRAGVLAFPRLIPVTPTDRSAQLLLNEVEPFLDNFKKPSVIFWGNQDIAYTSGVLSKWQKKLPQLETVEIDDAGHYIQEDAHEIILPQLKEFLDGLPNEV